MSFVSISFLFYFLPAALLLYLLFSFSRFTQNLCLLLISLLFYSFGEPVYIVFLLCSILVNYIFGLTLTADRSIPLRKGIVAATVVVNIAIILLGRYTSDVLALLGTYGELDLPRGLSPSALGAAFFSLQAMSYVFDVSRKKAPIEYNIINVGLYVAFFPTVLAGPILRYVDLRDQLQNRKIALDAFGKGCGRFVIGMSKQVLVASALNEVASAIFSMSMGIGWLETVPVLTAWLGLLFYGLYLYSFFSGFSDMAIGLAAMFGFSLKENFAYPLTAKSLIQFWERWHISLFKWFYAYVYLPMGGPRSKMVHIKGVLRPRNFLVRNLFVMWMLIGLWHGLNWNMVAWGIWSFAFYLFEWIVKLPQRELKSPLWHVYLLLIFGIGLIFLRSGSINDSVVYIKNLLGFNHNGLYNGFIMVILREYWLPLALGLLFALPLGKRLDAVVFDDKYFVARIPLVLVYYAAIIALFVLNLVFLSRIGAMPPYIFH